MILQGWNRINDHNGFVHHFVRSSSPLDNHGEPLYSCEAQKSRAQSFVDKSLESLHQHFKGRLDTTLFPAALLLEKPMATITVHCVWSKKIFQNGLTFLHNSCLDYQPMCHCQLWPSWSTVTRRSAMMESHHHGCNDRCDRITVHSVIQELTSSCFPRLAKEWGFSNRRCHIAFQTKFNKSTSVPTSHCECWLLPSNAKQCQSIGVLLPWCQLECA